MKKFTGNPEHWYLIPKAEAVEDPLTGRFEIEIRDRNNNIATVTPSIFTSRDVHKLALEITTLLKQGLTCGQISEVLEGAHADKLKDWLATVADVRANKF